MSIKKVLSEFWSDAPAYKMHLAILCLMFIPIIDNATVAVFLMLISSVLWPYKQIAQFNKFMTETKRTYSFDGMTIKFTAEPKAKPQPKDIPTTVIVDSPPLHVPDAAIDVRQVSIKSDGIGGFYTTKGQI